MMPVTPVSALGATGEEVKIRIGVREHKDEAEFQAAVTEELVASKSPQNT
jgi:hypothetical protein